MAVLAIVGVCALALVAMYTDWRGREIPHRLTIAFVLLWTAAAWLAPAAVGDEPWGALACGAVALLAGYGFHSLGWLGGGDGKLLAALALWLGPGNLGLWLLATAALGLVLVVLAFARRRGDFRARGIPFAWAMAPPAVVLLMARAAELGRG